MKTSFKSRADLPDARPPANTSMQLPTATGAKSWWEEGNDGSTSQMSVDVVNRLFSLKVPPVASPPEV